MACNDICIALMHWRHHAESGVSAWLGSTLCLVFDHGKSTLCLTFDVCREDMVKRHCVGVRCMS